MLNCCSQDKTKYSKANVFDLKGTTCIAIDMHCHRHRNILSIYFLHTFWPESSIAYYCVYGNPLFSMSA